MNQACERPSKQKNPVYCQSDSWTLTLALSSGVSPASISSQEYTSYYSEYELDRLIVKLILIINTFEHLVNLIML